MKYNKILMACALPFMCASASANNAEVEMNKFIDNLMSQMTLQEKLGQLNLPASDDIVTGRLKTPI